MSPKYPNFRFDHSAGLGVLGVGKNLAKPVKEFFDSVTGDDTFKREEADMVRAYFAHLGSYIQRLQLIHSVISLMHHQQMMINGWKQQTGRPVDPASINLQSAFTDCKEYALNLTRDIQSLLLQQQK